MNTKLLSKLLDIGFKYVVETSIKYKIDESHALKHSMEVYGYAKKIYESELIKNSFLEEQRDIIYLAAIGHDMCDKKYMDENEGVIQYKKYLDDSNIIEPDKLEIVGDIIKTMSYSKVKINGYPNMGNYQLAYHIVRESDLLAAYDIDRCIIYGMHRDNNGYTEALKLAIRLFDVRVFTMRKEGLFVTDYSKKESLRLHKISLKNVENLRNIL
jgi:hypothetical protein